MLEMSCGTKIWVSRLVADESNVNMKHSWNDTDKGEPNYLTETCLSAILSTKNPTLTDLMYQFAQYKYQLGFCDHANLIS